MSTASLSNCLAAFVSFNAHSSLTDFIITYMIIKILKKGYQKFIFILEVCNANNAHTLGVGALPRALASKRLARSYSLFSLSSLTAASQISSLLGFAWKASFKMLRAAGTSP